MSPTVSPLSAAAAPLMSRRRSPKPSARPKIIGWSPWIMWFLAAMLYGYQFILRVSPSVMVVDLMRDFSVDAQSLGILSACYYYTYATFQIPIGLMLDKFGPRRVLTCSALLLSVGAYLFASAETLFIAQCGRLLIGTGAAGVFLGTLKVISLWFPHHMFSILSSFTVMVGTLGAMNGGAPLTLLVDTLGWRASVQWLAWGGILMAILIFLVVRSRKKPMDPAEAASHPKQEKLMPSLKKVLASRQTWIIGMYGVCTYVVLSSFSDLWCIPFLQAAYGLDVTLASAITSSIYVGLAIGGPSFALLSERLQGRRLPMWSSALGVLICLCIVLYVRIPVMALFGLIFAIGFFVGGKILCFPAACEIHPSSISGTTVGFINMFCMTSGVIFQPLLGRLIQANWSGAMADGVPLYSAQDYVYGLSPLPICLGIAVIMGLMMKETYPRHHHSETPVEGI